MKYFLGFLPLLFSSCAVFEITREPVLAPPFGLEVFTVTSPSGENQVAVRFQGNNREVYFSGYRLYISTTEADLHLVNNPNNPIFALPPTGATILSNYRVPRDSTNMSLSYNGAMSAPTSVIYPESSSITGGTLINSPLTEYNGGMSFANGTTYYIGVYAYSIANNKLSIPSTTNFTFP